MGATAGGCEIAGFVAVATGALDGAFGAGCWAAIAVTSPRHKMAVPSEIEPALLISIVLRADEQARPPTSYLGVLLNLRKIYTQ